MHGDAQFVGSSSRNETGFRFFGSLLCFVIGLSIALAEKVGDVEQVGVVFFVIYIGDADACVVEVLVNHICIVAGAVLEACKI